MSKSSLAARAGKQNLHVVVDDLATALFQHFSELLNHKLGEDPRVARTRTYHDLTDNEAKILYAILRFQRTADGATPKKLKGVMKLDQGQVSGLLTALVRHGYATIARVSTGFGAPGAKQVYELESRTVITCRDTAAFLLELQHRSDGTSEDFIDVRKVLQTLGADKRLQYLVEADFCGTATYSGKINELSTAGEYIERVGEHFVRPRNRLLLETKLLLLIVDQPDLDRLPKMSYDRDAKLWSHAGTA
jgi:hypothetical protein